MACILRLAHNSIVVHGSTNTSCALTSPSWLFVLYCAEVRQCATPGIGGLFDIHHGTLRSRSVSVCLSVCLAVSARAAPWGPLRNHARVYSGPTASMKQTANHDNKAQWTGEIQRAVSAVTDFTVLIWTPAWSRCMDGWMDGWTAKLGSERSLLNCGEVCSVTYFALQLVRLVTSLRSLWSSLADDFGSPLTCPIPVSLPDCTKPASRNSVATGPITSQLGGRCVRALSPSAGNVIISRKRAW